MSVNVSPESQEFAEEFMQYPTGDTDNPFGYEVEGNNNRVEVLGAVMLDDYASGPDFPGHWPFGD